MSKLDTYHLDKYTFHSSGELGDALMDLTPQCRVGGYKVVYDDRPDGSTRLHVEPGQTLDLCPGFVFEGRLLHGWLKIGSVDIKVLQGAGKTFTLRHSVRWQIIRPCSLEGVLLYTYSTVEVP